MSQVFDVTRVREQFPSVTRPRAPIYLDNPAGTQVARQALEAVADYLLYANANHDGVFATGQRSDAMLAEARAAVADFLGAQRASASDSNCPHASVSEAGPACTIFALSTLRLNKNTAISK